MRRKVPKRDFIPVQDEWPQALQLTTEDEKELTGKRDEDFQPKKTALSLFVFFKEQLYLKANEFGSSNQRVKEHHFPLALPHAWI